MVTNRQEDAAGAFLKPEAWDGVSDEEIVRKVRAGEVDLFEVLMRRYNQRVYRVARAALADDAEAEDVTQEAWVRAFQHLDQFAERARFSTWLIRIALYEAWARTRRARRFEPIEAETTDGRVAPMSEMAKTPDPENAALAREMQTVLERAVESLPEIYRCVFVLRNIEGLSTTETAECLDLTEEAVKTRLHRARSLLKRDILARAGASASGAFPFLGARCDRMVAAVLARIGRKTSRPAPRPVP